MSAEREAPTWFHQARLTLRPRCLLQTPVFADRSVRFIPPAVATKPPTPDWRPRCMRTEVRAPSATGHPQDPLPFIPSGLMQPCAATCRYAEMWFLVIS